MMLNGPYPLRDLTTLGPTPRGHRRHVICPPDDVSLWSDSAQLLGIAVQVWPHPAVPVDEAFTWTAPPANPNPPPLPIEKEIVND